MSTPVIVVGLVLIALTALVTALVLRFAWARSSDPAEVDLRAIAEWERAREALARRGGAS